LRLDRFSPYFDHAEQYGIKNVHPAPAYSYVYPFSQESLHRLAYYFEFDYDDGRQPESYSATLNDAIERWHDSLPFSALKSLRSENRLTLFDTRPGARQNEIVLEGVYKAIYELCDEGQPLPTILEFLKQKASPITLPELQTFLNEMVERRLMLFADRRYISLAIPMDERVDKFIADFEKALFGQSASAHLTLLAPQALQLEGEAPHA
jgi:hypothetical protein